MGDNNLRDFLKSKGYNLIASPNNLIQIFDVLLPIERNPLNKVKDFIKGNSKPVTKIGNIDNFFVNKDLSLPATFKDFDNISFSNKSTVNMEIGLSMDYTQKLIQAFGGKIEGDLTFENVANTKFDFQNVKGNFYSPESIGGFINTGEVNIESAHYSDLQKGNLFMIYEIIKTNSFSIEYFDKSNNKLKVNIEEAKAKVKGNINIASSSSLDSKIYFESKDGGVVFGFKAVKLIFEGTFYRINKSVFDKLKFVELPDEMLDKMYVAKTLIFDNENTFKEQLKSWNISINSINKYIDILRDKCCFDRYTTKPKDKLAGLDGNDIVVENLITDDELFIDIE
jgi:hypothetical protein